MSTNEPKLTRQAFVESQGRQNFALEIRFDEKTMQIIAADEDLRRHIGNVAYELGEKIREAHEQSRKP